MVAKNLDMKDIDISIIVPIFNVEKYLNRCIDSLVRAVKCVNSEIILVDDGSTDGSSEICKRFSLEYDFIKFIHTDNCGVSAARNIGLDNAIGTYILFVDADDYVESNIIDILISDIAKTKVDLVVSDYYINFSGSTQKKYRNIRENYKLEGKIEILKAFLSGNGIGVNLFDKIFKRELIGSMRFNPSIRVGEDFLFVYQYLTKTENVYFEHEPLYHYVHRDDSVMNKVFTDYFFDILNVSDYIIDDISNRHIECVEWAKAVKIYNICKTIERYYKFGKPTEYLLKIVSLRKELLRYKTKEAKKYLSKKRWIAFMIMRISPNIYNFICRMKRI